jgi:PKD repeat protein
VVYARQAVSFQNTSTGSGSLQYQWNFDDGHTSAVKEPTHAFSQPGRYHVRLVVFTAQGTSSATQEILVKPEPVDLRIELVVPPPPMRVGGVYRLDAVITNAGSTPASAVVLSVVNLPAAVELAGEPGTPAEGSPMTWNIDLLAPGESRTLVFELRFLKHGPVEALFEVASREDDYQAYNNQAVFSAAIDPAWIFLPVVHKR